MTKYDLSLDFILFVFKSGGDNSKLYVDSFRQMLESEQWMGFELETQYTIVKSLHNLTILH